MKTKKKESQHGKKPNQKLKPYLVLQYLLKKTDKDNLLTAMDIVAYLEERGIDAERRSIYRDVEEINKAMLLEDDESMTIQEAEEILEEDIDDFEKTVVYDSARKGYYVRQRHYDFDDIRLLNECIYSAKFLTEGQTKRLSDVVCEFVSENQAKEIQHDAFLTDRIKTINKKVLLNIAQINDAIHSSSKITFKYLKYTISNLKQQVERRKGATYSVSPFALLLNDGYYYLLAYNDDAQAMRTYRVDRMSKIERTNEPREGEEAFSAIDLKTYTQRVFSMFGGEQVLVTIRFVNSLLDSVIDRFGTNGVLYSKVDDTHFSVTTTVDVSNQFFGWICGFDSRAVITAPPKVKKEFIEFIDKIKKKY